MKDGPPPAPEVVVLADPEAVANEAARRIAATLAEAIALRDRAGLALAGGDTPRLAYAALAGRHDVDWQRVEIFFGDERAVPPEHPDSNHAMARAVLLEPAAVPPARVHRMPAESPDLDAAARAYEAALVALLGRPPRLDLVLLGLGPDGHVASLFPHHAALAERTRFVVATPAARLAPRLTLTFPALAAARAVLFLVTGTGKATALARALGTPVDPEACPAQGVRAERVTWLVDRAAAGRPA